MHLPLFTVQITVNKKDEIVLIPSKTLAWYLRENRNLDEEVFIDLLPHPREMMKKEAPTKRWMCSCGILHERTIKVCGECGKRRSGGEHGNQFTSNTAWQCICGIFHPREKSRCEKCGAVHHKGGKPFRNIHARFGIKPEKSYADHLEEKRKGRCLCFYDKGKLVTTSICPLHGVTKNHV